MLIHTQKHSNLLPSSRTQHGLTKSEIVQGMANRFMYSKFYIGLYLALAILSFVTIVMVECVLWCICLLYDINPNSLVNQGNMVRQNRVVLGNGSSSNSPSVLFIVFEAIINFAMIIEVTTRLLALGRVCVRQQLDGR